MASFYVYIVYLFLILRQTHKFFFDVCMSMQLMQLLTNCNVLNAMKVNAVNTGKLLHNTVCRAYNASHPFKKEGLYILSSCGFSGSLV